MVNDTYKKDKLIGMVQSKDLGNVYKIGCLGKISDFKKIKDGRILINLNGITRFEIIEEIKNNKLYREFKVNYDKFEKDLENPSTNSDINKLIEKIKSFFKKNGLLLNWKEFDRLEKGLKVDTLSMISPITNEEKQKLLEAVTLEDKIQSLDDIINFYLHESDFNSQTIQ